MCFATLFQHLVPKVLPFATLGALSEAIQRQFRGNSEANPEANPEANRRASRILEIRSRKIINPVRKRLFFRAHTFCGITGAQQFASGFASGFAPDLPLRLAFSKFSLCSPARMACRLGRQAFCIARCSAMADAAGLPMQPVG